MKQEKEMQISQPTKGKGAAYKQRNGRSKRTRSFMGDFPLMTQKGGHL